VSIQMKWPIPIKDECAQFGHAPCGHWLGRIQPIHDGINERLGVADALRVERQRRREYSSLLDCIEKKS
jgi:hypothetical protein